MGRIRNPLETQIHIASPRGEIVLARSKILRSSVFSWATFVNIIISRQETGGLAAISSHFITTLVLAPTCTILAAMSAYVLNDLSDVKVDRINSPERPLVTNIADRGGVIALVVMLNVAALALSGLLGILPFLIILLETAGGIAYSYRPFGCKDRFILKTVSIGIAGVVSCLFGALAIGYGIGLMVVYSASMFFVFLFVTSPLNDLADVYGDEVAGRRTIPIVIGRRNTMKLCLFASLIPFLSSLLFLDGSGARVSMSIILGLLSLRSLQLLTPLLKDCNRVRILQSHKQMVALHFILQATILIGSLPLQL